jgi:hypothetical protein
MLFPMQTLNVFPIFSPSPVHQCYTIYHLKCSKCLNVQPYRLFSNHLMSTYFSFCVYVNFTCVTSLDQHSCKRRRHTNVHAHNRRCVECDIVHAKNVIYKPCKQQNIRFKIARYCDKKTLLYWYFISQIVHILQRSLINYINVSRFNYMYMYMDFIKKRVYNYKASHIR